MCLRSDDTCCLFAGSEHFFMDVDSAVRHCIAQVLPYFIPCCLMTPAFLFALSTCRLPKHSGSGSADDWAYLSPLLPRGTYLTAVSSEAPPPPPPRRPPRRVDVCLSCNGTGGSPLRDMRAPRRQNYSPLESSSGPVVRIAQVEVVIRASGPSPTARDTEAPCCPAI